MNLAYFAASLPSLSLDAAPPLEVVAFRQACAEQLDEPLRSGVLALLDDAPSGHPFVTAWRDRDTILRNAVLRRRAARHGGSSQLAQRPTAGSDVRIEHGVAAAFEQPDPLRREHSLDRLRWAVLDELQGNQPLTAEFVLAYAVRLRLASRWAKFNAEAGNRRLDQLTTLTVAAHGTTA